LSCSGSKADQRCSRGKYFERWGRSAVKILTMKPQPYRNSVRMAEISISLKLGDTDGSRAIAHCTISTWNFVWKRSSIESIVAQVSSGKHLINERENRKDGSHHLPSGTSRSLRSLSMKTSRTFGLNSIGCLSSLSSKISQLHYCSFTQKRLSTEI